VSSIAARYAHPGNGLKARREALGLSRKRLAMLAGVSPRTIYNVEHGVTRPQRSTAAVLAQALDRATGPLNSEARAANPGSAKTSVGGGHGERYRSG